MQIKSNNNLAIQHYLTVMNKLNITGLRKSYKMSQSQFSEKMGISQSYLSELETGKKPLTVDMYEAILENFENDRVFAFIETVPNDGSQSAIPPEILAKAVPLFETQSASCGMPMGFEVAVEAHRCNKYILPDIYNCDFAMRTSGRSMINRKQPERNIPERAIIGCRLWRSRTHIRWGEVYALATPDGAVVKQIMPSEKEGHVRCVSFNTEEGFEPYDLPVEEIQDWALVIGVVHVVNWI